MRIRSAFEAGGTEATSGTCYALFHPHRLPKSLLPPHNSVRVHSSLSFCISSSYHANESSGYLQVHMHCFTDLLKFGHRLLDHFWNLYIGVTGELSCQLFLPSVHASLSSPPSPSRLPLCGFLD
jgi:hypothetical protein